MASSQPALSLGIGRPIRPYFLQLKASQLCTFIPSIRTLSICRPEMDRLSDVDFIELIPKLAGFPSLTCVRVFSAHWTDPSAAPVIACSKAFHDITELEIRHTTFRTPHQLIVLLGRFAWLEKVTAHVKFQLSRGRDLDRTTARAAKPTQPESRPVASEMCSLGPVEVHFPLDFRGPGADHPRARAGPVICELNLASEALPPPAGFETLTVGLPIESVDRLDDLDLVHFYAAATLASFWSSESFVRPKGEGLPKPKAFGVGFMKAFRILPPADDPFRKPSRITCPNYNPLWEYFHKGEAQNTRHFRTYCKGCVNWRPLTLKALFGGATKPRERKSARKAAQRVMEAEEILMQQLAEEEEDCIPDDGAIEIDSDEEYRA
ncbi:hypothetical protein GGX14DRAFT_394452 [Mycena pura]|uniref:Uncharacterized protein n=1 Tax=Mycena pura TaxID=153505 RepID=A0AAD6VES9_9AGAR|nr:hypothetical protein GGX14DRAFT_394452 [Mycena pura]